MAFTAARLLNILPSAVIVGSMVTAFGVPATASAAAAPAAPVPYIVAIDAGHGGSPDNGHPDQLFDPGSVAGNGLIEKDLTLDVARRLKARLEAEHVRVVMTRSGDQFVSIESRMAAATQAGANLFVSIHFNFFQDPTVGGSVILYPHASDKPFAQLMSDSLATRLGRYGIGNGGVMERSTLWSHAPMPAVTVEAAYLTNKNEAEQLTRDGVRDAIASGVLSGVEAQAPQIQTLKAQIVKYQKAEAARAAAASAAAAAAKSSPSLPGPSLPRGLPVMQLLVVAAMGYLLVRYRRATIPVLAFAVAVGQVAHARAGGRQPQFRTRRGVRRRRSRAPLWGGVRP
ncbi:MAG: N-acetylmuramoyl-L-alanine amidase [Chloroflexota bacterium]|jgi:N-acetylmuramoyl-L-alanine amidase|nr:N-acetylmuramoyl-L-alanine amidase [Chloroflexota bacterium]